jgi:hypothetical protein
MIRKNVTHDMQKLPYRCFTMGRFWSIRIIIPIAILNITLHSCKKDPAPIPPLISFIYEKGYVFNDTTIATGQKVKIGIRAVTTSANLTYFSVRFDDGRSQILLDSGMNTPGMEYNLEVIKTNAPVEKWTFLAMDRNRMEVSVQIVLTRSEISKWGKIRTMSDIILGAQESGTAGSFFSLTDTSVMTLSQAYENQPMVDVVYYYGQYEGTLASPNEAEAPGFFTGPQGIASWTVKNETRYDTTMITSEVFNESVNDSLILSAYEPTAGKKKGKFVQPGMVFSFRSPTGKLGLLKVQEIAPSPAGSVKFTIKIQE